MRKLLCLMVSLLAANTAVAADTEHERHHELCKLSAVAAMSSVAQAGPGGDIRKTKTYHDVMTSLEPRLRPDQDKMVFVKAERYRKKGLSSLNLYEAYYADCMDAPTLQGWIDAKP